MTMLYGARPVANGLRTDHPIPGLPFVDDSHIPVEDSAGIEAVGRRKGEGMWGREDGCSTYGGTGWAAFTTDPVRHDLAWAVRWHPEHGRSVALYRYDDVTTVHQAWEGAALLFRAGGYWLDESGTWYRPSRVWDAPSEDYYRRPVPAAITVTAADHLVDGRGDPDRARVLGIAEVDVAAPLPGHWADHLALWAASRPDGTDLASCVVDLAAPELTGDQLVGAAELARIAGVAPSTLRAYIARGEAGVPEPQATVSGRSVWSRPVADEWAEQRRRSPEGIVQAVSAGGDKEDAPGMKEVRSRLSRMLMGALWEHSSYRRRWALRWRSRDAVQEVADDLSLLIAADLRSGGFVSMIDLAAVVSHALLDELAYGRELELELDMDPEDSVFYGITPAVERMLGWLIGCDPVRAGHVITEVTGEAERRLKIPRGVTERSLRIAASGSEKMDMDEDTLRDYLDRVMSPEAPPARRRRKSP